MPRNISPEELNLFKPFQRFQLKELAVKKFENVFVSHSGFCLDNNCLVKECHHDYIEKLDGFKSDALFFYQKAYKEAGELIELKDSNEYLLIHHLWFSNYYHWIC